MDIKIKKSTIIVDSNDLDNTIVENYSAQCSLPKAQVDSENNGTTINLCETTEMTSFYSKNETEQNKVRKLLYKDFCQYNKKLTKYGLQFKRIVLTNFVESGNFSLITKSEPSKTEKSHKIKKRVYLKLKKFIRKNSKQH